MHCNCISLIVHPIRSSAIPRATYHPSIRLLTYSSILSVRLSLQPRVAIQTPSYPCIHLPSHLCLAPSKDGSRVRPSTFTRWPCANSVLLALAAAAAALPVTTREPVKRRSLLYGGAPLDALCCHGWVRSLRVRLFLAAWRVLLALQRACCEEGLAPSLTT